jgi:hypothetical protein
MPADQNVHRLAGRIGGLRTHATHDPKVTTQAGRERFLGRFLEEVDPTLPYEERQRRASYALRAHMATLALASARARRTRAASARPWKYAAPALETTKTPQAGTGVGVSVDDGGHIHALPE